jgi:pseudouridine-5'-phosphate glycosidase
LASLIPSRFVIAPEISLALRQNLPVVALESAVITHGLPYPENLKIARDMQAVIEEQGAQPATIAILEGKIYVGVNSNQLEDLAQQKGMHKISLRDFGSAIAKSLSGGTTVAGTMYVAHKVGIRVFATGGIGGVHRNRVKEDHGGLDVSTDLLALANYPVIVVCAGAKAILDLPATLEVLETLGIPVIGYQTDEFPAFYSLTSGLKTNTRADNPESVTAIARAHWDLGFQSGILVTVPPPREVALKPDYIENAIQKAIHENGEQKIVGQAVTPYLLDRVSAITGGASKQANIGLLLNNAKVAAQIAQHWSQKSWGSLV